jgi:hypothetical protein
LAGFRSVRFHDFWNQGAWLDWTDLENPFKEHEWLPPDARYIARVILALSERLGAGASRFRVLVSWWEMPDHTSLPYVGDDVIVFCLGNELGRMPLYSHDVALVVKQYGVHRRPFVSVGPPSSWGGLIPELILETRSQLLRAPDSARSIARTLARGRRPRIVQIPIGTYLLQEDVEWIPFESRGLDLSFAGSMTNEPQLVRGILPRKTRARRRLIDAVERLRHDRPELRLEFKTIGSIHDAPDRALDYSEMMMNSRLALCPRGGSLETFRLFEAAAFGCIPMTEAVPKYDYFVGAPIVTVRDWSRLQGVIDRLLSDPDKLRSRHKANLEWWRTLLSPEATAGRIAAKLREMSPPVGRTPR